MENDRKDPQQDPRTTAELFDLAVSTEDDDEFHDAVGALWHRCSEDVADTARLMCHSEAAQERAVGAYVLGANTQICVRSGATGIHQVPEVIALLSDMLDDEDPEPLRAALIALGALDPSWGYMGAEGHGKDAEVQHSLAKSIPGILRLADHQNADVRRAVAHVASSLHDSAKPKLLHRSLLSALVELASDGDVGVRREAFIHLTSIETWSPDVRRALLSHLDDEDEGVRGLVLDELAARGEPGTVDLLIREITTHTAICDVFVLEAAVKLADSRLLPALRELQEQGVCGWQGLLEDAIDACSGAERT